VRKHFAGCGKIISLNLPLKSDGAHRGKAFVEFDSKAACDTALELHDGGDFSGASISVRMACDGGKAAETTDKWRKDFEVCVAGLPFSMSTEDVKIMFEKYGKIVAFRMPPDASGKHRGLAFVCFASRASCAAALTLHGTIFGVRGLFVYMSGDKAAASAARRPPLPPPLHSKWRPQWSGGRRRRSCSTSPSVRYSRRTVG